MPYSDIRQFFNLLSKIRGKPRITVEELDRDLTGIKVTVEWEILKQRVIFARQFSMVQIAKAKDEGHYVTDGLITDANTTYNEAMAKLLTQNIDYS